MLFALAFLAVTPEPPALTLFRAVCLEGQAQLRKDQLTAVDWAKLPIGAQRALSMSRFEAYDVKSDESDDTPNKIANPLYRVTGEVETYLLLPVPDGKGLYDQTCAVIVRQRLIGQARPLFGKSENLAFLRQERMAGGFISQVHPTFMKSESTPAGFKDVGYMSDYTDGHLIVAAQTIDWLLLSTAPDSPPCRLRKSIAVTGRLGTLYQRKCNNR